MEMEMEILIDNEQPQDDELCDVCKDGEVYEGNEILFCDKCNVAVHQSCYGVKRIPTGNWFCDVCKINGNPLDTKCELCKFTGGAYKQTENKGLWVHQLCANWQPEVYVTEKGGQTFVNLSILDKSRLRLKCSHCHTTGAACVQCSYGRCTVAVHPWCCLNDPRGFTKRIVKTPDGDTLWEIFCKTHASAISDPVKPHTKKAQRPPQMRHNIESSNEIDKIEPTEKLTRDRSKDGIPKVMTLTMNHAITLQRKNSVGFSIPKSTNFSLSPSRANGLPNNRTFPIRTMSEWPGQSEGEGMDLDHFWNVVSMYHPEDHPVEWLHFMKSGIFGEKDSDVDLCMPCLGKTDSYQNFPDEERMFEGISEKQRESIYNYEHRSKLRNRVEDLINNITLGSTCGNENNNVTQHESMTDLSGLIVENSEEKESEAAVGTDNQNNCYLNDDAFFIKQIYPNDILSENFQAVDKDGFSSLSVVFDGEKRASCEFKVKLLDSVATDQNSISLDCNEEHSKWVKSYLFQTDKSFLRADEKALNATVELVKLSDLPDDKPVFIADKQIIPNDENDEICRAIRADQNSLQRLKSTIKNKIDSFDVLKLEELTKEENEKRLQWTEIERKYESQVAWRKIATCLSRGMRDQKPDFNQTMTESLPASWQIQVDGRPTPSQLKEETNEPHEDAVCMVCFDGISKDNNNILFCDGCNAALHQACYGVAEIPEGDFFCDRCRHILLMTEDYDQKPPPYKIVEMVKCCLCPQYHGGIKPTEDGHWVHMCCAIWTKNAIIRDLKNMSLIDLSEVECDIEDPCIYCNLSGGYLRYCNCSEENCFNTFHPICAWFAGAHFEADITDNTFSGSLRNGLYPSGIEVKICCDKHSTKEGRKDEQAQLRKKYSHKIEDQCHLPGRRVSNSIQRKNKKKDAVAAVAQSRVASSQNKNQDLKVDVYDYKNCAMCCEVFDKSTMHYETDDKVICHGCSIHVHLKCLQEISPDFESGSSKFWTCDKCMRYPPEPAPSEGTWPMCEFCPRRGGAYKPMVEDTWTHVFCASNCNGKKTILPSGEIEVKLTGKVDKKHKCSLCNRKEGFLKCYNDGCNSYFHPLCAGRSTRTYIKTNKDGIMVWCTDHLPKWLHRTMQGVWINCADIEFLRWTLTNAQGLSNLVDNRIKLKRHESKTAGDLFSARFNKLLDDAKGREKLDITNEENSWIFETEGIYDGPEDEQAIAAAAAAAARVKKEPVVLPPGEQIDVMTSWGEMMTISANWTIGTTINAPKKVIVQHAGVDIIKKSTTVDAAEFKDKIKNGFRRQMQSPEFTSDMFHQYRDVEAFQTILNDHVGKYRKMPNELFTTEMTKLGVEIDQDMFPSKRKLKKEQQKESPAKRKKESARPNVVATVKPPVKHNYTYIDHNQLLKKLEEAPTFRNFCLSYVESKPAFDSAMDMLGITDNPALNDEIVDWKLCDKDELPSLERRMLDIISQISDYEVPEEEANTNTNTNTNKKSSKKSKSNVEMRKLSEDFTEIDLLEFPNYPDCVRRIVDINYIKDNIIQHKYSCMAQFTKDFYDLLNNARSFTDENLPAWKDAEELGKLFNALKKTSITDPNSYRHDRHVIKAERLIGSKQGSSSAQTLSCGVCSDIYRVANWPESAWPIEFEEKKGREKLKWHWKCPSCIESAGSKGTFLNSETKVKVWWLDDEQYYNGEINAYDEVSNRYRVLYEDDEWEFINIDNEPVLFLDDKNATINNVDKHTKSSNSEDNNIKNSKTSNSSSTYDESRRKSSRSR